MAKKTNYSMYAAVIVAFIAGYLFGQQNAAEDRTPSTSPAMEEAEDHMESEDAMMMKDDAMEKKDGDAMASGDAMNADLDPTDFVLSGFALEDGGVRLSWVVPDNRRAPERFMLVRGDEPNPVNDGNHYWYRQHGTVREVSWKDVPEGEQHFRICILEEDECVEYSNNLTLTVQKAD